jgi:two-component system OmpR family sensor kinase
MTLRARLTLAHLALLAFCLSAFGFGVYAYVGTELRHQFDSSLRTRGDGLLPILSTLPDGLDSVRPTMEQLRPAGDTFVIVVEESSPQQGILYKTESLVVTGLPDVPPGRVVDRSTTQGPLSLYALDFSVPDRQRLRALRDAGERPKATAANKPLFTGRLIVARSRADINASLQLLRTILIGGGAMVLAVAAVLGLGLSRTLLRPLQRMRAAAQRIGDERDFHLRLPVSRPTDELGRLAGSVNQMLTELEQAHANLKATLDAQRRFVGDASHELRTPVTAIRTNAEFLLRAPNALASDRAEALDDVLTEVRRMEQLVGDLLALARLEGAPPAARHPLRLDQLLEDVYRDGLRLARPGVEVTLHEPSEVWVLGDRADLRRAVWNLVENALKYGQVPDLAAGGDGNGRGRRPRPRRADQVVLRLERRGRSAILTVADNGNGIADDEQPFVFDRFWRAPSVRGTPGSGLGLAITKFVAQAHGGSVSLRSSVGRGTTFTVRLPATTPPDPGEDEREPDGTELLPQAGQVFS